MSLRQTIRMLCSVSLTSAEAYLEVDRLASLL